MIAAALLSPTALDAIGKIGAVGALLLTFGGFCWVFLKAGTLIKGAIDAAALARAADHREEMAGLKETTAALAGLSLDVSRLTTQVEELRRDRPK